MTVNQIASLNTSYRNLYINQVAANKSLRNLSSGYRINSAADNAAGLAISEKMRGQISGLSQASRNAQNGISMVQTAEGGLSTASSVLTRMRELAVQASNGTYSDDDRAMLNREMDSLKKELGNISASTSFNGINLLDGSLGGVAGTAGLANMGITGITAGGAGDLTGTAKFNITQENGVYSITAQIGDQIVRNAINPGDSGTTFQLEGGNTISLQFGSPANLQEGVITNVGIERGSADVSKAVSATTFSQMYLQIGANGTTDQRMGIRGGDMSPVGLGLWDIDISTAQGASSALSAIDGAINQVASQRGSFGAYQNRLEHSISNLGVTRQNLTASESSIRDADMAKEIMLFTQRSIQAKASQAMLAQGMNLSRQNMLGLLLR